MVEFWDGKRTKISSIKPKCNTVPNAKSCSSQTRLTSVTYWAKNTKTLKRLSTNNKTTNKLKEKPNKSLSKNNKSAKRHWLLSSTELPNWERNWPTLFTIPWTWWGRNKPEGMRRLTMLRRKKSQRRKARLRFTTLRICLWVGTANPFRIGCSSCMDWVSSISVKYVETTLTGEGEHSKCTSKSGDTLTAWDVSRFPTLSISETLLLSVTQLRCMRNWPEKAKMPSSGPMLKSSLKTIKVTFSTGRHIWTWKNKVSFDSLFRFRLYF